MKKLILASASPRRREILQQVGAVFEVIPAQGEEKMTKEAPQEAVMELALQKAREVADARSDPKEVVLGADTVVAFEGKILGKPKDETDAARMLAMLSGNTHSVFTGVAIIVKESGRILNFYEETEVTMYPMSPKEIQAYVNTGEPMDKAGAYGIQGRCAVHIEKIRGDYQNVVGLPVAKIYQKMRQIGIEICGNSYYDKK